MNYVQTLLQIQDKVARLMGDALEIESLLQQALPPLFDNGPYLASSCYLVQATSLFLLHSESAAAASEATTAVPVRHAFDDGSIIGATAARQSIQLMAAGQVCALADCSLPLTAVSQIALPLIIREKLIGVLCLQRHDHQPLTEGEHDFLARFAAFLTPHIEASQLLAQNQQRLLHTQTFISFTTALMTTADAGEIYRRATRAFVQNFGLAECVISNCIQQESAHGGLGRRTYQFSNGSLVEQSLDDETADLIYYPLSEQIEKADGPLTINRLTGNSPVNLDLYFNEKESDVSIILSLPLPVDFSGMIELFLPRGQSTLSPAELELAQAMAYQTAVAVEKALIASEANAQIAQLRTLNRLSRTLSQATTLKEMCDGTRREILSMVEATGMSITFYEQATDMLHWAYGFEYGTEVNLGDVPAMPLSKGFSGHVARTRQPLLVNRDFDALSSEFDSTRIGANASAWLGVPLVAANELIGILAVENEHDNNAFSDRDQSLLQAIATPLAAAINSFLQFEKLNIALQTQSEQRNQLQVAADVAAATTSILELDTLLQKAVHLIQERFNLYYVGLFLVDESGEYAVLRAGTGTAGRLQVENSHALAINGRSLIGGATGNGQTRITQDVLEDEEWRPNPSLPDTRSEVALPLRVRGQIIGALTVQSITPYHFNDALISILLTMSDQLAIAIDNAQLLRESEQRAAQEAELHQISTALHTTADVDEIIRIGLESLSNKLTKSRIQLQVGHNRLPE